VASVTLATRHGLEPSNAFVFVVPLCLASILGGIWISVHNSRLKRRTVVGAMILTACGTLIVATDSGIGLMLVGVVIVGLFLAPLSTSFSLFLDDLLPDDRRAEGFTLLRLAQAMGLIVASSVIALMSTGVAFLASSLIVMLSAAAVAAYSAPSVGRVE
jgi:hypothetical protein